MASQTTMNLRQYGIKVENETPFPEVTRIIDDDNSLDAYTGIWEAVDSNQNKITFYISKVTEEWIEGIMIDQVIIDYTVTDVDGNLLIDNRNLPNDFKSSFDGEYIKPNGVYVGTWGHVESPDIICGTFGSFYLKKLRPLNGPAYLEFYYYENFFTPIMVEGDCPDGFEFPLIPISTKLNFYRI